MKKKNSSNLLRKILISTLVIMLICTSVFSLVSCSCGGTESSTSSEQVIDDESETEKPPTQIVIPISRKAALKMDYEDLYDTLTEAGFTNVDSEGLEDLTSSKDKDNNTVSEITIDNKKQFKKGKKVLSNTDIFIQYHSVEEADVPVDEYDYDDEDEELDYEDVLTQFEEAGFTNIKTKAFVGNDKPEGCVKKISINGKTEYLDYSYPIDAKVVITYYTKKSSNKSSKNDSSTVGGVSAKFKKFVDGYEKFMDGYIDFMKKYKANPTDAELLSAYSDWMSDYADWAAKIEDVDQDELSVADAAYYLKVTARVTKKLSKVQ